MVEPYSPIPAAAAPPARAKLGCLPRALIGVGVVVILFVLFAGTMTLFSRNAFEKVKPEAVRIANEFAVCSLAIDKACLLRLSNWDGVTIDKGARFAAAASERLGKRGKATLDEKNLRYHRNAGVGKDSLRWRVQLILQVPYEKDPTAHEVFLLEDKGQGLKVVRMNWQSDVMLAL